MKCAEIMTANPKKCFPEDEVAIAIDLMWDNDCGAIPVVMNSESNKLIGIVTDRDIAMHVIKYSGLNPSQIKVCDCMVSSVVTCHPEDSIDDVIKQMGECQIRRIPIVDENDCCIGIVSEADLLLRAINGNSGYMKSVITALQQISMRHNSESHEKQEESSKSSEKSKVSAVAGNI